MSLLNKILNIVISFFWSFEKKNKEWTKKKFEDLHNNSYIDRISEEEYKRRSRSYKDQWYGRKTNKQ